MYTWYINLLSMCGPSFNFVCLSVPEKSEMKFFDIWKLERKKNEEIKGRITRRNLVLFHIKQQMIHNTCTKLQNPTCNSSWEIFVTNFPMYYIGVRDGKRRQNKSQFCFLSHNIRGLFGKFVEFGHKMFKYRYTPFIFSNITGGHYRISTP